MYDISTMPGYIPIGNQRDFGHSIQFDLTAWASLNADDWKITYTRPGEAATYPVPDDDMSVADNVLTWTISEAVTAINGAGSVVIEAYRGVEMLKHSDRIMTIIGEGHEPAGEAPDPVVDWIREADAKLDEVDESLERTNAIAGTLEGIAPLWSDVDISVSALGEGTNPTASITQGETGTSISLGIPKGDKGNDGKPFNYRGDYNPGADPLYTKNDVVRFGGGGFVYINDVDSKEPTSSASHWQQIASIGGQDLVDAAVAARDAAQGYKDDAAAYAAQLAAGTASPAGTYANLAALIAANPDHSKIYITLDDGNWCYHNGSAWVAGGVYQATERPLDTTLSVSGMAADAKVTGDKVGELKSTFSAFYKNDEVFTTELSYSASTALPNTVVYNGIIPAGVSYKVEATHTGGVSRIDIKLGNQQTYNTPNANKQVIRNETASSEINTILVSIPSDKISANGTLTVVVTIANPIAYNESKQTNMFSLLNNMEWEQGRYSATHGGAENTNQRIRTTGYISDSVGIIFGSETYMVELLAWFNGAFVGTYKGGLLFEKTTSGTLFHSRIDLTAIKKAYPTYQFKLTVRVGDGTSDIATTEGTNIYTGVVYTIPEQINYDKIIRSVNRIADDLPVPHQSIIGYKYAYNMGFRNFLCDLRFTSDNVPICVHDDYMNQHYYDVYLNGSLVPTSTPVYFAEKTYAELQDYDFGVYKGSQFAGTKILSLEQMLYLCKCLGCTVYLEEKVYPMTETLYAIVDKLITAYGMEKNVVWAPQSTYAVDRHTAYGHNCYIQFHTNTSGTYTDLPDSYIESIVNATNDYNRGRNTIIIPGSVAITDAQAKTLSDAGVGITMPATSGETAVESYLAVRKSAVEALTQNLNVGKYMYEKGLAM